MATTIYNFIDINPVNLKYYGTTSNGVQVDYETIINGVNNELDDTTFILIKTNGELMVKYSSSEVFYINDKLKNRLWFCNSIWQRLNDPNLPKPKYLITYEKEKFSETILYEMLKYASMMNTNLVIEKEDM